MLADEREDAGVRHFLAVMAIAMLSFVQLTLAGRVPAMAQDTPTSTTATTIVVQPVPDIVPRPNSGSSPTEAGDRGGALQLGILALVVAVIGGAVANLVRHSRRSRSTTNR